MVCALERQFQAWTDRLDPAGQACGFWCAQAALAKCLKDRVGLGAVALCRGDMYGVDGPRMARLPALHGPGRVGEHRLQPGIGRHGLADILNAMVGGVASKLL